jgi:RNA polymerase sigma-70 factor (ECF subfamily)
VIPREARASLSSAAEAAVIMLAAGGDDAAFAELVRRRQSWLRSLLRRLCRDAALADDLAQLAFLTAWRNLHGLREPGAFGGWLRSLAIRTWLQHCRRRKELEVPEQGAADSRAAAATDPSDAIDLDRLLARLKPRERLCVVLCHAEGMSHAEIVAATGWPLGTVKSHVARGVAQLRGMLGEETS